MLVILHIPLYGCVGFELLHLLSLQSLPMPSRMWILWFFAKNYFLRILLFWTNHDLMHAVETLLLTHKWYFLPNLLHLLLSTRAKEWFQPTVPIPKHEWFCTKWVSTPKLNINPPIQRLLKYYFPISQLLILDTSIFLLLTTSIKWSWENSIVSPISMSIVLNVNICIRCLYFNTKLLNTINQNTLPNSFLRGLIIRGTLKHTSLKLFSSPMTSHQRGYLNKTRTRIIPIDTLTWKEEVSLSLNPKQAMAGN